MTERCPTCGGIPKEKVEKLAGNVNGLLGLYDKQQQETAKLFELCLIYLEGKEPYYTNADIQRGGGVFKARKFAYLKHEDRKKKLIAAVHNYIKMMEERGKHD